MLQIGRKIYMEECNVLNGNAFRVYDPAYQNTAVAESAITFIDGDAGILQYVVSIYPFWQDKNFMQKKIIAIAATRLRSWPRSRIS